MGNDFLIVDSLDAKMIARLFSKIVIDENTMCWNWIGNCNQTGYGRIRFKGPKILVHRLMFAWVKGIPLAKKISKDNLILDHICNNKKCCNPDHLRLTTHKVNMLRGNGPSAKQARQTHCKNGHILPTQKNKYGRRICRLCNTIWARERYRRINNIPPEKFKV